LNSYDPQTGRWATDGDRYEALLQSRPEYRTVDMTAKGDPERAWPVLLRLVGEIDEDLADHLGASEMEDFVRGHGAAFIDRIEERAREDPMFRACLSCIWLREGDLPAGVQRRLLEVTGGAILVFSREEMEEQEGP